MKSKILGSLVVLFVCALSLKGVENRAYVFSQDELSKEYIQQFNEAMKFVESEDYKEALSLLTALKANNPNNANLDFYLGLCKFYLMFDKNISLEHFKIASKSISDKYINTPEQNQAPVESIYFEALSYHYLGQYAEAKKLYELYLVKSKTSRSDKKYVKSAKQKIEYCDNPDLVLSSADLEQISKKQEGSKPAKQDFAYKNKISKALEVMEYDHIEALILFKKMAMEYPNDPNVNYFMGISMLNYLPYQKSALGMFEVADKMIVSPSSETGLACPTMNRYYMAIANQIEGNHAAALKYFEEVEKVYPEKFTAFKSDFNEKMELSRRLAKVETSEVVAGELTLANVENKLEIKAEKDLHVVFPETKPRVQLQTMDRIEYSNSGYYYTVQIGEGFMREDYFEKAKDYRISRPKGSKYPRYLVGKYSTESEAASKKEELKTAGYSDAFVTRYKGRLN
ncbi:MAG: hypothetical protein PHY85_02040 [Bacteroidales bacterium]|nr:hypothetical protein [Bacteroidales bacterium]